MIAINLKPFLICLVLGVFSFQLNGQKIKEFSADGQEYGEGEKMTQHPINYCEKVNMKMVFWRASGSITILPASYMQKSNMREMKRLVTQTTLRRGLLDLKVPLIKERKPEPGRHSISMVLDVK